MKTLSEHEQDEKEALETWQENYLKRERQWLEELEAKDIPLYVNTDPKEHYTGARIAEMRKFLRDQVREGNAPRQGVACDHCGTELVDRQPGAITLSNPPKIYVGCPGCGWIGWQNC
jgi:uncharacterized protein with PIN domain